MIGRITLAIFLIPLVSAWIFGRVFCTAACPLGAVQHLLYSRKRFIRLPRAFVKISLFTTAAVLLATIFFALSNRMFLICELDPYRVLFFNGYAWFKQIAGLIMRTPQPEHLILTVCSGGLLIYTAVILVIGWWIPRIFCRFVCPYGVMLGVVSLVSFRQRTIDSSSCVYCGRCEKVCPVQAITIDRKSKTINLSSYHCVQCNECTDACSLDAVKS
jgi:polyferredoxin